MRTQVSEQVRWFFTASTPGDLHSMKQNSVGFVATVALKAVGKGYRVEAKEYFSGDRDVRLVPKGLRRFVPGFARGVKTLAALAYTDVCIACTWPRVRSLVVL